MTELENHLLSALKSLEREFKEQQKTSEQGQRALQQMLGSREQRNRKPG